MLASNYSSLLNRIGRRLVVNGGCGSSTVGRKGVRRILPAGGGGRNVRWCYSISNENSSAAINCRQHREATKTRRFFSTSGGDEKAEKTRIIDVTFEGEEDGTKGDGGSAEGTTTPDVDRSRFTEEVPVRMPDMGSPDGSYKIVEWFKSEGDVVHRDDILCDIETPDFTYGLETEDENLAILGKIHFDAPSEGLSDGQVICTLLHEEKEDKKKKKEEEEGGGGGDSKKDE